jgi:hypothetical protein
MNFATPACLGKRWYASIYFEEIGKPFPVSVGGKWVRIGRGREYKGQVTMVEIPVDKDADDIRILPPAIVLAVVASLEPTKPEKAREYMVKLIAQRAKVELVCPDDVAIVDDMALAKEVVKGNDKILQHLQVAEGKRKTFYGGKAN